MYLPTYLLEYPKCIITCPTSHLVATRSRFSKLPFFTALHPTFTAFKVSPFLNHTALGKRDRVLGLFLFLLTYLLLSTGPHSRSVSVISTMAKTTTLKEFESVFPKLVEDLLEHAKQYKLPEEFVKWYEAVCVSPLLGSYNTNCVSSPSMPTQSVENAIEECRYRILFPCFSTPHCPKSNTFRPLHWDG